MRLHCLLFADTVSLSSRLIPLPRDFLQHLVGRCEQRSAVCKSGNNIPVDIETTNSFGVLSITKHISGWVLHFGCPLPMSRHRGSLVINVFNFWSGEHNCKWSPGSGPFIWPPWSPSWWMYNVQTCCCSVHLNSSLLSVQCRQCRQGRGYLHINQLPSCI